MNAATFPATLEDLQRRDAAEAAVGFLVVNAICAAVAGLAWWLA